MARQTYTREEQRALVARTLSVIADALNRAIDADMPYMLSTGVGLRLARPGEAGYDDMWVAKLADGRTWTISIGVADDAE